MTRSYLPATCLLLLLFLLPGAASAAVSPEQLRSLNFNLYPCPCPANEMMLRDLQGRAVNLGALRGKVVILNFWRVDCPPCAIEKPILERIHRRFANRGLVILSANLFDDESQIRSYVANCGVTFTIAHDPEKRLSIRQQTLASGMPTTFVVNSNSEAIYEVAAVPTTYVIDRNGRIVGNSLGMINWEDPPFAQLLDSLLGPSAQTVAQNQPPAPTLSQNRQPGPQNDSRDEAPQTTGAQPPPRAPVRFAFGDSGWRREPAQNTGQGGPTNIPSPPAATGPIRAQTIAQANPPVAPIPTNPRAEAPSSARTFNPSPSTVPADRGNPGASAVRPQPRTPAQPAPAVTPLGTPPVARPSPPPVQPTPVGGGLVAEQSGTSGSLPPALPYNPAGQPQTSRARPPEVNPTENGYTWARIPGDQSARPPGREISPQYEGAARRLPAAAPVMGTNAIGESILESFGPRRQEPPPAPIPQQSRAQQSPGSSILGSIGEWVGGLKDALGGAIPGR
jgi:thiol-disulfide isomerase/thioredoxin